jgi:hypothetical protein
MTGTQSTGAVATTGAPACTQAEVVGIFDVNCSTSICHGKPDNPMNAAGLHLFEAGMPASFVGRPGVECPNELIINPNDPAASLLVTVLKCTAQCGVTMPGKSCSLKLSDDQIACVESWVEGVVAGQ